MVLTSQLPLQLPGSFEFVSAGHAFQTQNEFGLQSSYACRLSENNYVRTRCSDDQANAIIERQGVLSAIIKDAVTDRRCRQQFMQASFALQ
jgi:hypothetical protein